MPTEFDYAYLAGIIDGEGCIRIAKVAPNKDNIHKNRKYTSTRYTLRIIIEMCDIETISFISKMFGNKPFRKRRRNDRWRPIYEIAWTTDQAENLLKKILPYLQGKRNQAELALQFQYNIKKDCGGRKYRGHKNCLPQSELNIREHFYQLLRLAKKNHSLSSLVADSHPRVPAVHSVLPGLPF